MSKPAVIRAEFTDYRPVKTRKTVILSFEIPAEEQGAAFAALGYPVSGTSIWCAIARLQEGAGAPVPEKSVEPAKVVKPKPLRSNLAAVMCKENAAFQVWLAQRYPKVWDDCYYHEIGGSDASPSAANDTLKRLVGIASKKELDTDPEAAARFDALRTDFEMREFAR